LFLAVQRPNYNGTIKNDILFKGSPPDCREIRQIASIRKSNLYQIMRVSNQSGTIQNTFLCFFPVITTIFVFLTAISGDFGPVRFSQCNLHYLDAVSTTVKQEQSG
jgi:hypothetical protein